MTFAELIEDVRENLALGIPGAVGSSDTRVQNGEIKRLLNLAMREISLKVGIPTPYVTVPTVGAVSGAFSLPTRVHPEGVRYAEVVEITAGRLAGMWKNHEIAILSVAEANEFHPRWEDVDYSGIPFLLWSPADKDRGIQPVGIEAAQYRFLVHAVPEPMVDGEDEPFSVLTCDTDGNPTVRHSGAMPAYHRVLAHFASHELLQRVGDQRWQAYFSRYTQMVNEMSSQVQPATVHLPSWRSSRKVKRYA